MKRFLQRFFMIVFGVLLLAGLEVVLQWTWPQPADPVTSIEVAIDPFRVAGDDVETDPAFARVMRNSRFAMSKPSGVFRVFCLGGSTTMGYPNPPQLSWPAILEERLRASLPDQKFEVINLGANSYGTTRMLALLRGIGSYQPDLVIVAAGDTEFVEDSFRATMEMPGSPGTFIETLALARLLRKALPARESPALVDARALPLAGLVFSPGPDGTVYEASDERKRQVMALMRDNLVKMADTARTAGIPLVLCALPANLADWPPETDPAGPADLESRHRWQSLWREGRQLALDNAPARAIGVFAEAAAIWRDNASFAYDYGQALKSSGRSGEALPWLKMARDLDPVPIRATAPGRQIVEVVARERQLPFVDLELAFDSYAGNELVGRNLFFDFAHPNAVGQTEIARVVHLSLLDLNRHWQIPSARIAEIDAARQAAAVAGVVEENADLNFVWGAMFEKKGDLQRAEEMYRRAMTLGNSGGQVLASLIEVLARQGKMQEAWPLAERLAASFPDYPKTSLVMGSLNLSVGKKSDAKEWFLRAVHAGNTDLNVLTITLELLIGHNDLHRARTLLERAQQLYPGECLLFSLQGQLDEKSGRSAAAEQLYRGVVARDAACHPVWEGLGLLLMNRGEWRAAGDVFMRALSQGSPTVWPFHHLNLGIVYLKGLGQPALAAEEFSNFLVLQPEKAELVPVEFRRTASSERPRR